MVKFWVDGSVLGKNPSPIGVYWSVYRSTNVHEGVVIERERSEEYHTNNEAEWLALRAALNYAHLHYEGWRVRIYSDSMLIVKQFSGKWRSRIFRLHKLLHECRRLAEGFKECKVEWRPREEMLERLGH